MKSVDIINKWIKLFISLCSIVFCIVIYYYSKDIEIVIIAVIFSLIIILCFFIYEKIFEKYMSNILIDLSDMLDAIIELKDREIFSMTEDTIFSKLQNQTIKLTKILKSQNKRIEQDKNEIKSLISDIAHQLKTPLSNVKMYSEFLQDDSLSEEERKEFINIVLLSLNKLDFLVESMIKMSRLESGVIQLKPKLNSLNETVLQAIGEVQKKAKMKNINLYLNEKDKINIVHDTKWTCEAIINILDNAIKYTDEYGEIHIKIESYEIFTRIDISDNGRGISEDELSKIFLRFYRGKNTSEEEGIGIGLYLTREIISKQGGYIKVKSNKNGSTFSIFLPK